MAKDILIIRHAEKPSPECGKGIDEAGEADDRSLAAKGWQRAGAWISLFAPVLGMVPPFPVPWRIFAASLEGRTPHGDIEVKTWRPQQTVRPLARFLGLGLMTDHGPGQEGDLARALDAEGVSLVCWQHQHIVDILRAVAPALAPLPPGWPPDRYNVLLRLRQASPGSAWTLEQSVPLMLDGDVPTRI